MKKTTSLLVFVFLFHTVCISQSLTWYRFDKTFITATYPDSAMGQLSFRNFHPAANVHDTSCGGDDGELHIGMRLPEVNLPTGQMPITNAPKDADANWGLVAELPNASHGNGPSRLTTLTGKPITFHGYFRVWDEGHGAGASPASNPHHVFEIHPAWGFDGTGVSFTKKNLVASMTDYSGYGASKFKPMFKAISSGAWPLAYQDGQTFFLGLVKNANFYQLPVIPTSARTIDGGHEFTVEVFSDAAMKHSVFENLNVITTTGSPIDAGLQIGKKTFLLGFFSVNLKKALGLSTGAHSPDTAVSVSGALEFFAFGIALNKAATSCL